MNRIHLHVDPALTEIRQRTGNEIGRAYVDTQTGVLGAKGQLVQVEARHEEVSTRRDRPPDELARQAAITSQAVERLASALILPPPERDATDMRRHQPLPETRMTAMRVLVEYEENRGCGVPDGHKMNVGYEIRNLDPRSGELRLIETEELAGPDGGSLIITPNGRRVAQGRRDSYWLDDATDCSTDPVLREPIRDPERFPWHEVRNVQRYDLTVNALAGD